jgi:hypothetical protein
MTTPPANLLRVLDAFGPHLNRSSPARLATDQDPDRLVKTHCCFCGQQCGIQLKVKDNTVIGFEPWYEFPFNRGMLCPKGVKRYLHRVSHLDVLRGPVSTKEVVVRERLETSRLPNRQAPALERVMVDVVVAILADMGDDRRTRTRSDLDAEAIRKMAAILQGIVHAEMIRQQIGRKVLECRGLSVMFRVAGGVEVPVKVAPHVGAAAVVADAFDSVIFKPVSGIIDLSVTLQELSAPVGPGQRDFTKHLSYEEG